MKTLNQLISDYTCHLQQGEIQLAYKGILEFIENCGLILSKNIHITTQAIYIKAIWTCLIFH